MHIEGVGSFEEMGVKGVMNRASKIALDVGREVLGPRLFHGKDSL